MRIHFIAIGGSVMHNLAIALKSKGHQVTGSDDEVFEPSLGRLKAHGLLPEAFGWRPETLSEDVEAVILGKHAKADNPELLRAQELGLKVYSFPEFVYEHARNKQRIVVAGSHGKTTMTAMIMHVLRHLGKKFDYLVGAQLEGFETMVSLSEEAPIIVIEGDEYPTSPLDDRPKFLHYHHHIGVVTGIAWDHFNAYPTLESYHEQFEKFVERSDKAGTLIYCEDDEAVVLLVKSLDIHPDVRTIPYKTHPYEVVDGKTFVLTPKKNRVETAVFGAHNMQNLSGAMAVCERLNIKPSAFYEALRTFKGAGMRLELIGERDGRRVFRDFAHAPSKVLASTKAVKGQFPGQPLVACVELHTFSSLNADFLGNYKDTMAAADVAVAYYNPKAAAHKELETLSEEAIRQAFHRDDLRVFTDKAALSAFLLEAGKAQANFLIMSSGNFDGWDVRAFAKEALQP